MEIHSDNKTLGNFHDFRVPRVHGSREKGWESASQDKGHLAELREFAGSAFEAVAIGPSPLRT